MTPTKNDIKKWLKTIRKDREWLAKQCGLNSKQSVDNWFATTGKIPKAKLLLIQRLMAETQAPPYEIEGKDNMGKLFITLNEESQEAVLAESQNQQLRARQASGASSSITLSAYCSLMMEWCATTQEGHAVIQSLITGAPLPSVNMNLAPLVQSSTTNAAKEKEAARKKFTPVETFTTPPLEAQGRIIGNIAAGNLADGDTIPQDIRLYRELEKGEYLLRVNGHSMEPSIPDGSVVIMKKYTIPPIPKPGTIVQYHDERGVTLKKLVRRKNPETGKMEYTLHPINPDFGDIEPMDGGKISGIYVETLDRWEKA